MKKILLVIHLAIFATISYSQESNTFIEKFGPKDERFFDLIFAKYESDFETQLNERTDSIRSSKLLPMLKEAVATRDQDLIYKIYSEIILGSRELTAFGSVLRDLGFKAYKPETSEINGVKYIEVEYFIPSSDGKNADKQVVIKFRTFLKLDNFAIINTAFQLFTAENITFKRFTPTEIGMMRKIFEKRNYSLKQSESRSEYHYTETRQDKPRETHLRKKNIFALVLPDRGAFLLTRIDWATEK